MGLFKKITDFIMPLEPLEEKYETEYKQEEPVKVKEPEKVETQEERAPIDEGMKTAEGGSVAFAGMKYTAYARKEEPVEMKPQLTLVKSAGINVKINKPAKFEEVRQIADDLLGKSVVIVNYELVSNEDQRRINDFVNGVCFVTDGHVNQISERIVLYTPEGIDAEMAMKYAMR